MEGFTKSSRKKINDAVNAMTKKEIRNQMRLRRDLLSPAEIKEKSEKIFNNLLTIQPFVTYETVLCYINIGSEVDTSTICRYYQEQHKKTAAPKICGKEMAFYYFQNDGELSAENRYHIPEPVSGLTCTPDARTLMILPGLVFDRFGVRIGYGGGYYDRYLQNTPSLLKIAVAYQFQIVSRIPEELMEPTDIRPDYLVTEQEIIPFS